MSLVHHIWSPNSIVSAAAPKEMRQGSRLWNGWMGWRRGAGVCHTFINQTHVFEHVHEAWSKAPGFVSVALKGADSDLGGALRGSSHHVDGVVHQSCFSLKEKQGRHHPSARITNHVEHLSHHAQRHVVPKSPPKNSSAGFTGYMEGNQSGNNSQPQWAQCGEQFYSEYFSDCTHNQKATR